MMVIYEHHDPEEDTAYYFSRNELLEGLNKKFILSCQLEFVKIYRIEIKENLSWKVVIDLLNQGFKTYSKKDITKSMCKYIDIRK